MRYPLEVYGSRRKVLFVEGVNGKEDVQFYQNIFEEFLVKPCGSCKNVIEYTKSLRGNENFHHLKVYGLIDRDRRTNKEIADLETQGVYTLAVAEVENIFATPEILKLVSEKMVLDFDEAESKVKDFVFKALSEEFENQVFSHTIEEIKHQLNGLDLSTNAKTLSDFVKEKIDDITIKESIKNNFQEIINQRDYKNLLRIYNRKTIASRIGTFFGLKNDELPNWISRLSKQASHRSLLRAAVIKYLPDTFVNVLNLETEEKNSSPKVPEKTEGNE